MKVLVTGAEGFIGRNLGQRLAARPDIEVVPFSSASAAAELPSLLRDVGFVVHLAGANRPADPAAFMSVNQEFTAQLCDALTREAGAGHRIPVIFTSSIQAGRNDSLYAQSKRAAEQSVFATSRESGVPVHVFRLPNVFGKWCRPNYNSAVATFCYNIAHHRPLEIHDANASLSLVYIDDVVERFVRLIDGEAAHTDADGFELVEPVYQTTVGAVANYIRQFRESRDTLTTGSVGIGLLRALHSTYLSYLEPEDFSYPLKEHADHRGRFVEVLKTADSGQFSFFTALPGITRGGHYHHTKTEKFLVIRGRARFKFRHVQDDRTYEIETSGDRAQVVETVPGWAHDVTNVGDAELFVMLWANEVFDPEHPDTYSHAI